MTKKRCDLARQIILIILATCVVVVMLFPLYWIVIASFKRYTDIQRWPPVFLPTKFDFTNYIKMWQKGLRYGYRNSLLIGVVTVFLSLGISTLPAYALSRFKFRGSDFLPLGFLLCQLVPPVILVIPFFLYFKHVGLLNTHLALILVYTTFSVPVCIWMLKGYFDSIPVAIEEAAYVDGCNRMQALLKVIFPLALPGIGGASIYAFMLCWQEFVFALTIMRTNEMRTVPVVAVILSSGKVLVPWQDLATTSVIAILPIGVVFLLLQRFLIYGLSAGALKE